jgi:hypothetical protein
MAENAEQLRAAAEKLIAGPAVRGYWRPRVGYDECVASKALRAMLRRHERDGTIQGLTPLWSERRVTGAGGDLLAYGGAPSGRRGDLEYGRRVPGDSWSDADVIGSILANLFAYPPLVVLTADWGRRPDGRPALLRECVKPALNATTGHGRTLVLLFKRPKTSMKKYVASVDGLLMGRQFAPGYKVRHL